ncbi:MAG: hypothetical protein QMB24_17670 [Spirosomataceae bacterium]
MKSLKKTKLDCILMQSNQSSPIFGMTVGNGTNWLLSWFAFWWQSYGATKR